MPSKLTQGPPSSAAVESLRRSVTALERLFGVIGGFGLTMGVKTLLEPWLGLNGPLSATFPIANTLLFFALLVTLVPFFHGAVRHLDKVHLFSEAKPQPKRLVFDYSMLFVQCLVFVALGLSVRSLPHFWALSVLLIGIDTVWAIAMLVLVHRGRIAEDKHHIWRFLGLDCIALAMLGSRLFLTDAVPWLQRDLGASVQQTEIVASAVFVLGAVLRSGLDYYWNWGLYFDTTPAGASGAHRQVPASALESPRPAGTPKVYLAGPDVFLRAPDAASRAKKDLCARYGFIGVFPLDAQVDINGLSGRDAGLKISRANEGLIRDCQLVIAQITPFRGPSADVGTAYEMGVASALALPVFAYSNMQPDFAERTTRFVGATTLRADSTSEDSTGMLIESFGLVDNLMLVGAVEDSKGALFTGATEAGQEFTDLKTFEACLKAAQALF